MMTLTTDCYEILTPLDVQGSSETRHLLPGNGLDIRPTSGRLDGGLRFRPFTRGGPGSGRR